MWPVNLKNSANYKPLLKVGQEEPRCANTVTNMLKNMLKKVEKDPSRKFHGNPSSRFYVILLTNKQPKADENLTLFAEVIICMRSVYKYSVLVPRMSL